METEIFSKGLFSTWLYVPSHSSAFDAGEGIGTGLGNRIFGIERLFVSHDHIDHIGGILPLVGLRRAAMGSKETPLTIYHPPSKVIESLKKAVDEIIYRRTFDLNWVELEPGQEVPTGSGRARVKAFAVEHGIIPHGRVLGYSIIEPRRRLKKEWVGRPRAEIIQAKEAGENIEDTYMRNLWTYSGDAYRIPAREAWRTEMLIHDCSFLKSEDREKDGNSHATLDELKDFEQEVRPKQTFGIHISARYKKVDMDEAARRSGRIILVPPGRKITVGMEQRKERAREKEL